MDTKRKEAAVTSVGEFLGYSGSLDTHLNSLDDTVGSFVSQFRKGSIHRELPREVLDMTVEEALQHSSTVRKLLIDLRFAK